jgi:hypothetical protein
MKNATFGWLAVGAVATAMACGGGTTNNNGNDAGSGSGSGTGSGSGSGTGSDSGSSAEAGTCTSKADCPSGEICCGTSVFPPASGCVTTCPSLAGAGPVQLCATSDECAGEGYVCQMFGLFNVCLAPTDGGFPGFDGGRRTGEDAGPDAAGEVDAGGTVDGGGAAPDAAPMDAAGGG